MPRLLDLFCGAGGAAMGYHLAGFEVVGVDVEPQPNYPFEFHQADALLALGQIACNMAPRLWGLDFDAIHASPPCQAYSILSIRWKAEGRRYPDLIGPTRQLLDATGLPYVIENVPRAPLRDPIMLCGTALGLPLVPCRDGLRQVWRHRLFELGGFDVPAPPPCDHSTPALGVYGKGYWSNVGSDRRGGYQGTKAESEAGMDIDWHMNQIEIAQAIPPAYTAWIGRHLLAVLRCAPALSA